MRNKKEIGKKMAVVILALSFLSIAHKAEAQSGQMGGKNWGLRLSGKSIYDDNVGQTPRNEANRPAGLSGGSDAAVEFSGQANYKFNVSNAFSLSADYALDNTTYIRFSQYDLQSHTVGGNVAYKIKPTWRMDFRYMFIYNLVDYDKYNGLHYVSPSMMFMLNPAIGFTRINYTFKNQDNYQTDLRDTDTHSIGVDQYIFFSDYKRRLRIGFVYRDDDATGTINNLESFTYLIGVKTPLFWEIVARFRYRYKDVNFDSRAITAGGGIRNDDKHQYLMEFSKDIVKDFGFLEKLSGYLKYQRETVDSVDKLFEHDKNVLSFALRGKF